MQVAIDTCFSRAGIDQICEAARLVPAVYRRIVERYDQPLELFASQRFKSDFQAPDFSLIDFAIFICVTVSSSLGHHIGGRLIARTLPAARACNRDFSNYY